MAAISEAKAGVASEILSMIRLLGAGFGVAMAGALIKALENAKVAELLAAAGASLDASERTEIKGLLSGSDAAEDKISQLAPSVAEGVERVVREAFVYALDGTMLLCMAVSVMGALAAFLVSERTASSEQHVARTPDTGDAKA